MLPFFTRIHLNKLALIDTCKLHLPAPDVIAGSSSDRNAVLLFVPEVTGS